MFTTKLNTFSVGNYNHGNKFKILIWSVINYFILNSSFPFPIAFKVLLLRMFGAEVGEGLVMKLKIRIKYPWRLKIGNNCWIGESVWIDNLEDVKIMDDVCISQGALLLTGNHDYTISSFPYKLGKIILENGVWIGANAVVCPNVVCQSHSVLTVNSVATKNLEAWSINAGNPAIKLRNRVMKY